MRTKAASSRSFGFLLAAALGVGGGLHWGTCASITWLVAAGLFLAIAIVMPRLLFPLKRLWLRLGHLLHVVVSPVILGLLYVFSIVSVGLLGRLFGKDPLSLNRDAAAASYWIRRDPPGPSPESLKNQY